MIQKVGTYTLRFVAFMLLQVFVLNDIYLFGIIHPYLYILFLFTLPVHLNKGFYLLAGFMTGLVLDIFVNTPGFHASASLVFVFFRNYLISAFKPLDDFSESAEPHISTLGPANFFIVIFVLTLLHHFTLYFIEVLTFGNFLQTLLNATLNTLMTFLLVVITELIIFYKAPQVNEPIRK